jgi:hypothetical protein
MTMVTIGTTVASLLLESSLKLGLMLQVSGIFSQQLVWHSPCQVPERVAQPDLGGDAGGLGEVVHNLQPTQPVHAHTEIGAHRTYAVYFSAS